jgi:glucose-6-phosphate 1-dehydrogenase
MENPFREGLLMDRPAEPCAIVIFGATGDLAQRKLFPALLHLCQEGRMSNETVFVAVSRGGLDLQQFRAKVFASAKEFAADSVTDEAAAHAFLERIFVHTEDTTTEAPFRYLQDHLNRLADSHGTRGNLLFYLSIPPTGYDVLARKLGASGLAQPTHGRWARIIIEKPFGRDLASALHLNSVLEQAFHEITISAKRQFRILWSCGWRIFFSSHSGTTNTSIMFRSPPPNRSELKIALNTMMSSVRCAI